MKRSTTPAAACRFNITLFAILLCTPTLALAERSLEEVSAITKAAFQPPEEAALTAAETQLRSAIAELDAYLKANPAVAEGWHRYLKWETMQAQLELGRNARVSTLREVALQFFADQPGLELPVFRNLGNALRHYANTLYAVREEDLKTKYDAQVDEVAKLLAQYPQDPSVTNAAAIAESLKYLARYGKPDELLLYVRNHYARPNVYLRADEELIVHGVRRNLNEITPINEMILGTQVRGTGRTVGRLDAQLQPSADHAVLNLLLSGTTSSRTVGTNRSALIYSQGNTTIRGYKQLTIDDRGIHASPSAADADTNTRITGIGSTRGGIGGCIVTRVASKRAAESKGQATAIATQRARGRIRERMDREAQHQLEVSNRDLQSKFREPLKRAGTYPAALHFSSTSDDLHVAALEAGWTQVGPVSEPPALEGSHAVAVTVHESAVNNAANTMLSGRTIHDYEIRNEVIRRRGSLPPEMQDDEDRDPWSITFIDEQPVRLEIANGGFQVLLKFSEFTSGERKLRRVNVAASYTAERDGARLVLVRQGDLNISREGEKSGERIPIGEVALRPILRTKFSKLFKERIEGEGLELPGKYKSMGKLPLGNYVMANGWAALGWQFPARALAAGK